jgi:uncharacterized membrane protein YdfJ with MMPL/SSD domain
VPSLESEVTRAVEVVISREKQLLDIYEALREQKEKLSSIVNQMLLRGVLHGVLMLLLCCRVIVKQFDGSIC